MGKAEQPPPKVRQPRAKPAMRGYIGLRQTAELLSLSVDRVEQLVKSGHVQKVGANRYDLVASVQGYIRFLREDSKANSKSAAASRVTDARAQEIELRIAERMHRLIDIDEHDAVFDEAFGMLKSNLIGIPVRVTKDMTLRRRIEDEINGALAQTASELLEKAASLRASGEAPAAEPEDDAG